MPEVLYWYLFHRLRLHNCICVHLMCTSHVLYIFRGYCLSELHHRHLHHRHRQFNICCLSQLHCWYLLHDLCGLCQLLRWRLLLRLWRHHLHTLCCRQLFFYWSYTVCFMWHGHLLHWRRSEQLHVVQSGSVPQWHWRLSCLRSV